MKQLKSFVTLSLLAALLAPFPGQAAKAIKASPFSASVEVREFIRAMHERHAFDTDELSELLAQVRSNAAVLKAIRPPAASDRQRSWERYRARFVNERRLGNGLVFWQENQSELAHAAALYEVPPEIIVAIIGVETEYGRNMGQFKVLEALATLAFDYPPRAPFFRNELEQFLLLARENGENPLAYLGSYAGAMGIPQFMPSSQREYAVDFDGDGRIDLRRSVADAIGSVARYLHLHGWRPHEPVAWPVRAVGDAAPLLAFGIKPEFSVRELHERGVELDDEAGGERGGSGEFDPLPAALIDLVSPGEPVEYWLGFDNFYVLTRYNRSSFYAMSVFQLAEALRNSNSH